MTFTSNDEGSNLEEHNALLLKINFEIALDKGYNSFILFHLLKSSLGARMGTVQFLMKHTLSHTFPCLAGATVRAC